MINIRVFTFKEISTMMTIIKYKYKEEKHPFHLNDMTNNNIKHVYTLEK